MKININVYQIFGAYHAECAIQMPAYCDKLTTADSSNLSFLGCIIDMGNTIRNKHNIGILDTCHELTIKLIHA